MISLSYNDLWNLGGIVVGFLTLLVALLLFASSHRRARYDQALHRAELDMMRRAIEGQMYSLNEKLVATEGRWRDVNHLVLSAQDKQTVHEFDATPNSTRFLRSAGILENEFKVQGDLVFVITPFHPKYRIQFETIAASCRELGLTAKRGDEDFVGGDVFPHILRLILNARIIVVNIDGRNPNVFYELGIAQALGKLTILVSGSPKNVPFDVRTKRLVVFESLEELGLKLRDEIGRVLVKGSGD